MKLKITVWIQNCISTFGNIECEHTDRKLPPDKLIHACLKPIFAYFQPVSQSALFMAGNTDEAAMQQHLKSQFNKTAEMIS